MIWFLIIYVLPVAICWISIVSLSEIFSKAYEEFNEAGGGPFLAVTTLVPMLNLFFAGILVMDLVVISYKFKRG